MIDEYRLTSERLQKDLEAAERMMQQEEDGEEITFDLDCSYPIFEPHMILQEMQKILAEVRLIYTDLKNFGVIE